MQKSDAGFLYRFCGSRWDVNGSGEAVVEAESEADPFMLGSENWVGLAPPPALSGGGLVVGDLPGGGLIVGDLPGGGVTVGDLPGGGVTVGDLPGGGLTVGDLPGGGFVVGDLPGGGMIMGDVPVVAGKDHDEIWFLRWPKPNS